MATLTRSNGLSTSRLSTNSSGLGTTPKSGTSSDGTSPPRPPGSNGGHGSSGGQGAVVPPQIRSGQASRSPAPENRRGNGGESGPQRSGSGSGSHQSHQGGRSGGRKNNDKSNGGRSSSFKLVGPKVGEPKSKLVGPKAGEPKSKEVDGKTYWWCPKCSNGNGRWTLSHGQPNAPDGVGHNRNLNSGQDWNGGKATPAHSLHDYATKSDEDLLDILCENSLHHEELKSKVLDQQRDVKLLLAQEGTITSAMAEKKEQIEALQSECSRLFALLAEIKNRRTEKQTTIVDLIRDGMMRTHSTTQIKRDLEDSIHVHGAPRAKRPCSGEENDVDDSEALQEAKRREAEISEARSPEGFAKRRFDE